MKLALTTITVCLLLAGCAQTPLQITESAPALVYSHTERECILEEIPEQFGFVSGEASGKTRAAMRRTTDGDIVAVFSFTDDRTVVSIPPQILPGRMYDGTAEIVRRCGGHLIED